MHIILPKWPFCSMTSKTMILKCLLGHNITCFDLWPLQGHLRPLRGYLHSGIVCANNFWLKRDKTCGWSYCASLVETHRMICNMTYLGTSWPWPEVKFWPWPFEVKNLCSEPSRREKHDGIIADSLTLLVPKLFVKNEFRQKPDLTSGDLDIELSEKMTEIASIRILTRR